MKKIHIVILCFFTLNIAGMPWWFSDTQVIKRQTQDLAETLTMLKEDEKGTRALKSQQLAGLLSDSFRCSVQVKDYNHEFSKTELTQAHLAMTSYCQSSSAEASDISINFDNENTATVTSTLYLSATETGNKTHSESCNAELTWEKNEDRQWRLIQISLKGK